MAGVLPTAVQGSWYRVGNSPKPRGRRLEGAVPLTWHRVARQSLTLSLLFIWSLDFLREDGGLLISTGASLPVT